jgi:hypothetical protein
LAEEDKKRFQDEMAEYEATRVANMDVNSPQKIEYGNAQSHHANYAAHPGADHDPNQYAQYYQDSYDAAVAFHHHYPDYYSHGYAPAPQTHPNAYAQQHEGHEMPHEQSGHNYH